jgi:hypothetical protein
MAMTGILLSWRDCRKNAERPTWDWDTNAGLPARLLPGDRFPTRHSNG